MAPKKKYQGKRFRKKASSGDSSANKSNTGSSSGTKVITRTKLSDYVFNVGNARNASEFNQIFTHLTDHIKMHYDEGDDIHHALIHGEHKDFSADRPTLESTYGKDDKGEKTEVVMEEDREIFKILYSNYSIRVEQYRKNTIKAYAFLWSHCSKAMQTKIKSMKDFESRIFNDPVELMKSVKELSMSLLETKYHWKIIWDCIVTFASLKQKDGEDLIDYYKRFEYVVSLFKAQAGNPLIVNKIHSKHAEYKEKLFMKFCSHR